MIFVDCDSGAVRKAVEPLPLIVAFQVFEEVDGTILYYPHDPFIIYIRPGVLSIFLTFSMDLTKSGNNWAIIRSLHLIAYASAGDINTLPFPF
jgi:hypothetical protein